MNPLCLVWTEPITHFQIRLGNHEPQQRSQLSARVKVAHLLKTLLSMGPRLPGRHVGARELTRHHVFQHLRHPMLCAPLASKFSSPILLFVGTVPV